MPRLLPGDSFLAQSAALSEWLVQLDPQGFAAPSALPGWDVRTLVGHVLLVHRGLLTRLDAASSLAPITEDEFVSRYRRDVVSIEQNTRLAAGELSPAELQTELSAVAVKVKKRLAEPYPAVIETPRGPTKSADFIRTRVIEVVVHADDLSRSLPGRPPVPLVRDALADVVRSLAAILAARHAGRAVEVRVAPFTAVQCVAGPRHTRGTPANVVETDPVTFLRLATGRISWSEAVRSGAVAASGLRADLSDQLPLLS